MNQNRVKLYQAAEQRCKPKGCAVTHCMRDANDPQKCQTLMKELRECIDQEMQYLLNNPLPDKSTK